MLGHRPGEGRAFVPEHPTRVPGQDPSQSCWKGEKPPLTHWSLSLPVGSEPQLCSALKPVRPEIAQEKKKKKKTNTSGKQQGV